MKTNRQPTETQFGAYTKAFDHFNLELFEGKLPSCLLNFSRAVRSRGLFAPSRWIDPDNGRKLHEISLNPDMLSRPLIESMGTLVHEMVHLWQEVFGKRSKDNYHNREWAEKMEEIGLMPSDTGTVGRKRTGRSMTHYIIEGGRYANAFARMPKEFSLPWISGGGGARGEGKIAYQCPGCLANAWGKPGLALICGVCMKPYGEKIRLR